MFSVHRPFDMFSTNRCAHLPGAAALKPEPSNLLLPPVMKLWYMVLGDSVTGCRKATALP
jgi:hypothetical protein